MTGHLRLLGWAILAVAALLAVIGGVGYWLYDDVIRPGPLAERRTIVISPNTGLSVVATVLADEGVNRHRSSISSTWS